MGLSIGPLRCAVLASLALLIAANGCSSTHAGGGRGGDAGTAAAAPKGAGESGAAARSSAGAGRVSGAGGASGASTAAGAGAGSSGRECRTHEDCDPFGAIKCYMPGTSPAPSSDTCGAPDWCGRCSCPHRFETPPGWGTPRTGRLARACPAGTVCDDGYCQGCTTDDECGGDTPRCATYDPPPAALISVKRCVECAYAADCGGDTPVCSSEFDPNGPGRCIECSVSAPCAVGVCMDERCVPGCSSDAQCESWQTCSAEQRCVVRGCTADADCPLHYVCTERGCAPRNCKSDAGCTDDGVCVLGICHATPGTCMPENDPPMQP